MVTAGPAAPLTAPVETEEPVGDTHDDPDRPWVVIVWNDPINLMVYVTFVLQKLFGYPLEVAEKLMLQVHYEGRAVVSNGHAREGRARRLPPPRARPLGHDAAGLMTFEPATPR